MLYKKHVEYFLCWYSISAKIIFSYNYLDIIFSFVIHPLGDSEVASSVIGESEIEGEDAKQFLEDVRVAFPQVLWSDTIFDRFADYICCILHFLTILPGLNLEEEFLHSMYNLFQVLRVLKTRQVTYSVLNHLIDYVENLEKVGLLEKKEMVHLHDAVQVLFWSILLFFLPIMIYIVWVCLCKWFSPYMFSMLPLLTCRLHPRLTWRSS